MSDDPEFRTALEEYSQRRTVGTPLAAQAVREPIRETSPTALILPEVGIERAKKVWEAYQEFKNYILSDEACFDVIAGTKQMNRTGATRLAVVFGLSIAQISVDEGRVFLVDDGAYDYRFRVLVRVSKGLRFADGIGSCRISEIIEQSKKGEKVPYSEREHFALTRAWTRAAKRAIADLLGGTEAE